MAWRADCSLSMPPQRRALPRSQNRSNPDHWLDRHARFGIGNCLVDFGERIELNQPVEREQTRAMERDQPGNEDIWVRFPLDDALQFLARAHE
jgi:hypothetical protein